MEGLSETLDQVVLDIFSVLEDLYDAKSKLQEAMKEGYFQMSRTRYGVGVKRVGADQIVDAEMTHTRSVTVSDNVAVDFDMSCTEMNESVRNLKLFELVSGQKGLSLPQKDCDDEEKEVDKEADTTLRQRGKKNSKQTKTTDSGSGLLSESFEKDLKRALEAEGELDERKDDNKFVLTNPINLFGVLVPQSLRCSQSSFQSAVSLCVDIANLQFQLSTLERKYKSLLKRKQECEHNNKDEKQA